MQTYAVTLPHYSIGPEAYDHFDFVARFYGTRVAVIGGETALAKAGPALRAGFAKAGMTVTAWAVYGKDATNAAVERVLANDGVKTADVIFGVGGGRAVDTVKAAADILKKPFFTCPTVASNCAPVSAISVIYNEDGSLSSTRRFWASRSRRSARRRFCASARKRSATLRRGASRMRSRRRCWTSSSRPGSPRTCSRPSTTTTTTRRSRTASTTPRWCFPPGTSTSTAKW